MYRRRTQVLSYIVVIGGLGALLATQADSQGAIRNFVFIQGSTPGISQSGHSNISGSSLASQFVGGGAGLTDLNASSITSGTLALGRLPSGVMLLGGAQTAGGAKTFSATANFTNATAPFNVTSSALVTNLNADKLDGFDETQFLVGIPNPLILSGSVSTNGVGQFTNTNGNAGSSALLGIATSLTGSVYGGRFQTDSSTGFGVYGIASSITGAANAGYFLNQSPDGAGVRINSAGLHGVYSETTRTTGAVIAGLFSTASNTGTGISGISTHLTGTTYAGDFTNQSSAGFGLRSTALGQAAVYGVLNYTGSNEVSAGRFETTSLNANAVYGRAFGAAGSTVGGRFLSDFGTGVYTEGGGGEGIWAKSTRLTGTSYGGKFETSNLAGAAVYGISNAITGSSYGGHFITNGPNSTALYAQANATTGSSHAGQFENLSTSGYGVRVTAVGNGLFVMSTGIGFGLRATSVGDDGVEGESTVTTGFFHGGRFSSASSGGFGVRGVNTATSGATHGGYFESDSPVGFGVTGISENIAVSGLGVARGGNMSASGPNGRGVVGIASDAVVTNSPYGVHGTANTATFGFGVYAVGDMGASGVKPFRIDHPLDPLNQYLLHYAAESPFPQNFYSGNVTTDAKGYAWVELPDYFEEINVNVKYQLTIVDDNDSEDFVQAKISKKIRGNRFQIRTSQGGIEVSWRIEADRNDLRVRYNRPTDVRTKSANERGLYQHPEYYGQPASMGMNNLDEAAMEKIRQARGK